MIAQLDEGLMGSVVNQACHFFNLGERGKGSHLKLRL